MWGWPRPSGHHPCGEELPIKHLESSHVEPGVLEVEVALNAVHDRVADPPLPAEIDHGGSLGVQELAAQPLVVLRALLDRAVVRLVETGSEPVLAEAIGAAQPLGR